jgi:hypothetical protein
MSYSFARNIEQFCKNRRDESCSLLIGVELITFTPVQRKSLTLKVKAGPSGRAVKDVGLLPLAC